MLSKKAKRKNIQHHNKISISNDLKNQYNKCYKKYCNKIITKKQLTKKFIKQFDNFEKGKNSTIEKRKNVSLVIKSNKCSDKYCNKFLEKT
jgi:hypothetical protein